MMVFAFQEERDKAQRTLDLVQAELHANEVDYADASNARCRFFDLRDVVLKEQEAELKKQIAALDVRIKRERELPL